MSARFHLRRYTPKGLFGRSVGVLLALIVLIHGVSGYVFFHHHWPQVRQLLAESVISQARLLADVARLAGPDRIGMATAGLVDWQVSWVDHWPKSPGRLSGLLMRTAQGRLPYAHQCAKQGGFVQMWIRLPWQGAAGEQDKSFFPERILFLRLPARKLVPRSFMLFLSWAVGSSLVFVAVAVLLMRAQVLPLRRLMEWTKDLDREDPPRLPEIRGAQEIRRIAVALAQAVDRVRQTYQHRHQVVMGISHDLRTPLARLRLQLSMMAPGPEVEGLRQDVDQLCAMVSHYLDFARQEDEPWQEVDLQPFLTRLISAAQAARGAGAQVIQQIQPHLWGVVKPLAFQRGVQNVLDNALRHCRGKVWVRAYCRRDGQGCFPGDLLPGAHPLVAVSAGGPANWRVVERKSQKRRALQTGQVVLDAKNCETGWGTDFAAGLNGPFQPHTWWRGGADEGEACTLILDIEDDGPGVDKAVQGSIFEPFFRGAEGRSLQGGSVGLGLAIAAKSARAHQGILVLMNLFQDAGQGQGHACAGISGAVFRFVLPGCGLIRPFAHDTI